MHQPRGKTAVAGNILTGYIALEVAFGVGRQRHCLLGPTPGGSTVALFLGLAGLLQSLASSKRGSVHGDWVNGGETRGVASSGALVGAGVALALQAQITAAGRQERWLYGCALGAAAYALVDLVRDAVDVTARGKRLRLQPWKVYAVEAVVGGLAGGALAWYFDLPQANAVIAKFKQYAALHYAVQGMPIKEYVVYPLFSKWGAMNLGVVNGPRVAYF